VEATSPGVVSLTGDTIYTANSEQKAKSGVPPVGP
jgi:hypothetical protein